LSYVIRSKLIHWKSPRKLDHYVASLVSDPASFAGISGHILVLMVENNAGNFVTLDKATSSSNKFRILFTFGNPFSSLSTFTGKMERKILNNKVTYIASADDKSISFMTEFAFQNYELSLSISASFNSPQAIRYVGMNEGDLERHLLEGHFLPYFKLFAIPSPCGYLHLESKEGNLCDLISTIGELRRKEGKYLVYLESNDGKISGRVQVENGNVNATGNLCGKELNNRSFLDAIINNCRCGSLDVYIKLEVI